MLTKFPLDKISGTKMPSFFFRELQIITVLLFRFLYELKHQVRLSKTVWDFPFSISFPCY